MPLLEHYRELYEHEKDGNNKMLAMLESVPEDRRGDARFQRAVSLAGHLAACRENFVDFMTGKREKRVNWFDERCELITLRRRFAAIEREWTDYLSRLDESELARDFDLIEHAECFSYPIETQIIQLNGHAFYHRGQVALLVDQLGGETVDTDYVDWALNKA